MNGCKAIAATQRQTESRHVPLAAFEAENANKRCSVCQKERHTADSGAEGERGLKVAVNSDRVMTEIDLESRLGFAHPVLDAHAQSTIKELKQEILQQFGPLSHISSDKKHTLQPIMSKSGQRDSLLRVTV